MKTMQVRVLRAFYFNGKPTKVDTVIEVPAVFGAELIAAKKAEAAEPPAKAGPSGDDASGDDARNPKGGRNAR